MQSPGQVSSSVDQGPYVNVADGMVAPTSSNTTINASAEKGNESNSPANATMDATQNMKFSSLGDLVPIKRCVSSLISRGSTTPIRLLAYVALLLAWPTVGSALQFLFARREAALRGPLARRR